MQNLNKKKPGAYHLVISADQAGQRLDNFLLTALKGVPKSHIYRIIRKGEVRVNSKRISAFYRLKPQDDVRLPPVAVAERAKEIPPADSTMALLKERILFENDELIILNKPSGMSVHAGNTVRVGIIEALRHLYPKLIHLELAHRLDAETSGCLVIAKKKRVLRELHDLLRAGKVTKLYWALTAGRWKKPELHVDVPLHKHYREGGKHVVMVSQEGKQALTVFRPLEVFKNCSLVEAALFTGRTHQIRVHAAHQGHPIAMDDRYGDDKFNKMMREMGLKRMFLHAHSIDFILPSSKQRITVRAPLDTELEKALATLRQKSHR